MEVNVMFVYVLNKNGEALMPCKPRKARLLLKEGKKDIDAAERLILKEFKEGRIVSTVIDELC